MPNVKLQRQDDGYEVQDNEVVVGYLHKETLNQTVRRTQYYLWAFDPVDNDKHDYRDFDSFKEAKAEMLAGHFTRPRGL